MKIFQSFNQSHFSMTAGALSFRYFVQAQSAYDFQQNRAFLYPSNFKILDFPRNDFALIDEM